MIPARSSYCLDGWVIQGEWWLLNPSQTSSKGGGEHMQGKGKGQLWLDLSLMRRHEKFWRGLSLWGKQVWAVVIRTSQQALHAHIKTNTHAYKQINILLQITLSETAHSASNVKLKWHPFQHLHCCSFLIPSGPCSIRRQTGSNALSKIKEQGEEKKKRS